MSDNSKGWLNLKYEPLPGEFVHKDIPQCMWTKLEFILKVENDKMFYSDDILMATYPKSGTTVLQEMIWLISNNVDTEGAKRFNIVCRFPFIEENYEHSYPNWNFTGFIINNMDKVQRPRFLKTHLTYRNLEYQMLMNPEMKVVTCFRNPKDTAVSMYHFYKGVPDYGPYTGSWDDFFERWYDGWIAGGDWLHVTVEWWSQRHRPNLKIIFFEDIVSERRTVIKDLSTFLNKHVTEEEVEKIVHQTDFKIMKENPSTNYSTIEGFSEGFVFMRKGEIGDWKNYFSEEQCKRLDDKYNPVLKECGLTFRYE